MIIGIRTVFIPYAPLKNLNVYFIIKKCCIRRVIRVRNDFVVFVRG